MEDVLLKECDYMEAQLLSNKLAESGISCNIIDKESVMTIMTSGGNTSMMCGVYVAEKNYEEAISISAQLSKNKDERISWCPECGSEDIIMEIISKEKGSIGLLVGGISSIIIFVLYYLITFNKGIFPGLIKNFLFLLNKKKYEENLFLYILFFLILMKIIFKTYLREMGTNHILKLVIILKAQGNQILQYIVMMILIIQ